MRAGPQWRRVVPGLLMAALAGRAGADEIPSVSNTMQFMQEQMHRIADGLLYSDLGVVAEAAKAISVTPRGPEPERVRIVATLGTDIETYERIELVVRNTARNLAQAALRDDHGEALHTYFRLMDGCMACHRDYQKRVGQALASAGAVVPDKGGAKR